MAEYIVQDTTLTAIANAVRTKKGTTEPIALVDLAAEIENIQSGGGSDSNKLALVVGPQSADNPYDITASDLGLATEIKEYTFYQRNGLRSIDLPTTCASIGNYAFGKCSALTSVDMLNVESIGQYSFSNCKLLPSVSMPNVTSIGYNGFAGCSALASVSIPKVKSLGDAAFYSCSSLTSISMPKVTSIGSNAFQYCSALTSLTIPSTCTSIGSQALQCGTSTNKCTFTFEGTTPPSIQSDTFNASDINKIIVPTGCGEAYKTATNWSSFANYIEEATE